jgi:hypothetical protein
MKKWAGLFEGPEGTLPGMLGFVHESITAAIAQNDRIFFKDLFLKLLGVGGLNLVHHPLQLMVNVLLPLREDPIKVRKDPNLSHIGQAPRRESLSTSAASTLFHKSPGHSVIRYLVIT